MPLPQRVARPWLWRNVRRISPAQHLRRDQRLQLCAARIRFGFVAVALTTFLISACAKRADPEAKPSDSAEDAAAAGRRAAASGEGEPAVPKPGVTAGTGAPPVESQPAGTCPANFVRCAGLCLEAAVMGPDCRPRACSTTAGSATPARSKGLSARGFEWSVLLDGATTRVTFKPGKATGPLPPTVAVELKYRLNAAPELQTAQLTAAGDGTFTYASSELKRGDALDFYFHQTTARQKLIESGPDTQPLIDTMWFHQIIGEPREAEPAYPLTVQLAGRFRDRHPNEQRYDHYVDTYFAGPTFDLTLIDHGDALDVTIAPQPSMEVEAVDFKTYECFGSGMGGALPSPTPLCFTPPALAAVGVRATAAGETFKARVDQLAYGQLVDFELTFVRSRTYYSEWFQYFVGSGRLQPKVQHPWAHAAGDQSVTDVTVDEFGYAQHVPNITPAQLSDFIRGKVLFEADFESLLGYNPSTTFDCARGAKPGTKVPTIVTAPPPSPLFKAGNAYSNPALAQLVRPGYTASSCFTCHHLDGKGPPPDENGMGAMLLKLFSVRGEHSEPDPVYGSVLDPRAAKGGTPEVRASVTWQTIDGKFADGTPYALRKPLLALDGLRDGPLAPETRVSARIPRPVFGLGFLEAVPAQTLLALADPEDANQDGISGRANFIPDPATGEPTLGRFGWKSGTTSLKEQAALAFVNDIGITSPLYPKHRCGPLQPGCLETVKDAAVQLAASDLDHLESYLRELSVPPRRNYADPQAIEGKQLFVDSGCSSCHVPNLVTGSDYEIAELRNLNIQPFTDLLLHDMGDGLADDAAVEEGSATGHEWRTCPLWGNGTGAAVMYPAIDAFDPNGHPPVGGVYLHDGRARSISEAILWHGGEAQPMRDSFIAMPAAARAALVAYVAYPFADPVFVTRSCGM